MRERVAPVGRVTPVVPKKPSYRISLAGGAGSIKSTARDQRKATLRLHNATAVPANS